MYFEHLKGLASERFVENDLIKKGWQVVLKRNKSPFAEIDLLMQKNNKFMIVEVKSISNPEFVFCRLGHKQKQRLLRACEYFIQKMEIPVDIKLAIVDSRGRIEYFDIC